MISAKDIRPWFPCGFLLDGTITGAVQRQYPILGRIPSYFGILGVTSCTFKYSSAFGHTKHDCLIAPRLLAPSQAFLPLFTELHTLDLLQSGACRSIRDFVTSHTRSGRNYTCRFKCRVQISFGNLFSFIVHFYTD